MKSNNFGSFIFVLHSHLPYVLFHGKWPHGTDWLDEAAAETYIPILNMVNDLVEEGISPKFSIGLSPILTEQLASDIFKTDFVNYLRIKIDTAKNDSVNFGKIGESHLKYLSEFWLNFYENTLSAFNDKYNRDIIPAFKKLDDSGCIDIITCGATHGYFPLLGEDFSIDLQVKLAVDTHEKHFGKKPHGIWMPECAYRPSYPWKYPVGDKIDKEAKSRKGVEEFLTKHGIKYTFIDSHLLKGGKAIGTYADRFDALSRLWKQFEEEARFKEVKDLSPYKIYNIAGKDIDSDTVSIFTRDPKTGLQVWSGDIGYPGDGNYLEFHKKHFPGGMRYWKVTSAKCSLGDKDVYNPEEALSRTRENAYHYAHMVKDILNEYNSRTGEKGVITAPYDAELFGHWWFEGPEFLKEVFRNFEKIPEVNPSTAKIENLNNEEALHVSIPEGSWGEGGYHYIWMNEDTDWTWIDIYRNEQRMMNILDKWKSGENNDADKVVHQMVKELLLMQSSDWQFLISTFAAKDYAENRLSKHHRDFNKLAGYAEIILSGKSISDLDWNYVDECIGRDIVFSNIDSVLKELTNQ